jgi:hypothetical protein
MFLRFRKKTVPIRGRIVIKICFAQTKLSSMWKSKIVILNVFKITALSTVSICGSPDPTPEKKSTPTPNSGVRFSGVRDSRMVQKKSLWVEGALINTLYFKHFSAK